MPARAVQPPYMCLFTVPPAPAANASPMPSMTQPRSDAAFPGLAQPEKKFAAHRLAQLRIGFSISLLLQGLTPTLTPARPGRGRDDDRPCMWLADVIARQDHFRHGQ